MELSHIIKASRQFAQPYAVTGKRKFRLKDFDPGDNGSLREEGQTARQGGPADGCRRAR